MKIILIIIVVIVGIGAFYFIANRTGQNWAVSQQNNMQQPPAFPE